MRKFSIFIDSSETKLNGDAGIWLTEPEGLGINNTISTIDLRNGFFKSSVKNNIPRIPIVGTITFTGENALGQAVNAYEQYRNFQSGLLNAEKIEFGYCPYGSDTFRREVELGYITKGEKDGDWLSCALSLQPLTPWYLSQEVEVEVVPTIGDTNLFIAKITPQGDMNAAIEMSAEGGGTPWTISAKITSNNKSLGGFAVLDKIVTAGNFEYSSHYNDSHALFTPENEEEIDLINRITINEGPFIRLPPGVESQVTILYDSFTVKPEKISIKVLNFYRSV